MASPPAGGLCPVLSILEGPHWNRAGALALFTALLTTLAGPVMAQLPPPGGAAPAQLPPGRAAPEPRSNWVVTPSLRLAETYTDNVFLSPNGLQQSDWVTQVTPGISVTANGPQLRLYATYTPEIFHYAETERDDKLFHRGNAVGTLQLTDRLLYLEAGARVDQYDTSLQGPITTSNVNVTGNRATTTTAYVSPYLLRDIGTAARAEARFNYSTWHSDQGQRALPDNTARRVYFRLVNGPAARLFTWDTVYWRESIEYETLQKTTSEQITASGQQRITGGVRLLGLLGYERYDTGIEVVADPRWSAGFEWTPTPRTRLALTAGRRLDEPSYGLDFIHRTRLTTWNVTYAEDVTTSRGQFLVPATQSTAGTLDQMLIAHYPDPVARQKAVQEVVARTGLAPTLGAPINFFSTQLFLQKTWQASVGLQGARNTVVASAFWQERLDLAPSTVSPLDDFAISQSIRTSGGTLAWNLRLSARNMSTIQFGRHRTEFVDTAQVDHFTYLRAGLSRQFQPRVSGALSYRRQARQSTQGAAAEYRENAGVASLLITF